LTAAPRRLGKQKPTPRKRALELQSENELSWDERTYGCPTALEKL
jgi:hypothetical protein